MPVFGQGFEVLFGNLGQERHRQDAEGFGEQRDVEERGVALAPFDAAHVVGVQIAALGQAFLGQSCLFAEKADLAADFDEDLSLHQPRMDNGSCEIHTL